MVELTRKEYNIISKNRGIIEPQKMSTKELMSTLSRYDSRLKVKNNRNKIKSYCLKCRKDTENIDPKVSGSSNGTVMTL